MFGLLFDNEVLEIIMRTLRMTLTSTFIAFCIGVPLGLLLEKLRFPGKKIVVAVNRTFMATPPVVAGLVVLFMLRREGPFGHYGLLFSLEAMIIAQVLLITPIICGMVHAAATKNGTQIRAFAFTMGANRLQTQILLIRELSNEIFFAAVTGFGRAMSEVGAIMMVGGNIRFHTRVMTTMIALDARRGFFEEAVMLGVVLMVIAFIIQMAAYFLTKRGEKPNENF